MCFYIESPAKVAHTSKICYKIGTIGILTPQSFAPYYKSLFIYTEGVKTPYVSLVQSYGSIEEGYHSFTNYQAAEEDLPSSSRRSGHVGVFMIPEGTLYYHNKISNQYVSSRLIYLGPATVGNRIKFFFKYLFR